MKTILIIRLSAMGDVAMTSPVVSELRKKYPELNIVILTRPFFNPFFRDIPDISFVDIDLKARHKGFYGIFRLFREIKNNYKIDYVADLHDVLRSKILRNLFQFNGAKVSNINKGRTEKKQLTRQKDKIFKPLKSTFSRYIEVFDKLGFKLNNSTDNLTSAQADIPQKIYSEVGDKDVSWIGISPFAQHQGKIYPLVKLEKVIEILNKEDGLKIFIFGGGEKEKKISEEWGSMYKNTYSVIGKLSLTEELDLISNLDVMLSMDSSAMHMSSLVGTPAVSVWGATHPYAGFMGYGQDYNNAVQIDMECRPCSVYGNKPCYKRNYPCLNEITPDMIINKILNVIAK